MRHVKALLTSSWLLCSALALLLLLASLTDDPRLRRLDLPLYDQLLTVRQTSVNPQVVLLTLDQQSRQQLGEAVASRTKQVQILRKLQQLGVQRLALLKPLSFQEQQTDDPLASQLATLRPVLTVEPLYSAELKSKLPDQQLLQQPDPVTDPKQLLLKRQNPLAGFQIKRQQEYNFLPPAQIFFEATPNFGHLQFTVDADGQIRRHPLLLPVNDKLLPSLPLQLVLQNQVSQLTVPAPEQPGQLTYRTWQTSIDRNYQLLLDLSGRGRPYLQYNVKQLLTGELDDRKLDEKLVLLGSSEDFTDRQPLATRGMVSSSELAALATASLLSQNPPHRPSWGWQLETLVLVYFLILLLLLVPRLSARAGLISLGLFAATWLLTVAVCLVHYGYRLQVAPALLLCSGGFFIVRWKVGRRTVRHNMFDNHRQLAVTLQEQGRLDQALEQFLQFQPKDDSCKEMLYNLGIDFERKRMPHKALTAYRHLLASGRFRDTRTRIKQLHVGEKSPPPAINPNATLILDRPGEKPTLGRYRIEKVLGQGAMGTVYLGVDPKINRQVAIKTLTYPQVEPDQLTSVKERFFLEAEAAGQLSHPKIVTIYDVGEENDLAYLAMEWLNGKELGYYCQPKKLLDPLRVVQILKQVAQALDYAHQQGVVHRDIKPANIIILDDGQIKVTDFGIARMLSSSQTETGTILGTPSYMSPEQVAGKKVDGRSDLFSLGVVMYELLSGEKPFQGESMAALMYNIANCKYRPLEELRPKLPAECLAILAKLLQKTPMRRYKSAGIVAMELQNLQQILEKG
jgi:serine/threonine-protein kinase